MDLQLHFPTVLRTCRVGTGDAMRSTPERWLYTLSCCGCCEFEGCAHFATLGKDIGEESTAPTFASPISTPHSPKTSRKALNAGLVSRDPWPGRRHVMTPKPPHEFFRGISARHLGHCRSQNGPPEQYPWPCARHRGYADDPKTRI